MTQPLTSADGLSTLVLTSLPPAHRKLIRLILRKVEPSYAELCQAVADWPGEEQMSPTHLDEALKFLHEQHYLVVLGEAGDRRYKVSFSRRASRELTQNLWDVERVGAPPPTETPPAAEASGSAAPPPAPGDNPTTLR